MVPTIEKLALRTAQCKGYPSPNDHWRRITTVRSLDNGATWADKSVHFSSGKAHSDLLTLADGRILLTYAVRHGELDGRVYQGIEAVLSEDNGRSWEWASRFYLFRWHMHGSMHSPQSVQLSDGRIMTVFLYHYDAPNHGGGPRLDVDAVSCLRQLNITSAIICMCRFISMHAQRCLAVHNVQLIIID